MRQIKKGDKMFTFKNRALIIKEKGLENLIGVWTDGLSLNSDNGEYCSYRLKKGKVYKVTVEEIKEDDNNKFIQCHRSDKYEIWNNGINYEIRTADGSKISTGYDTIEYCRSAIDQKNIDWKEFCMECTSCDGFCGSQDLEK